jgi:hypothetical protein
MLTNLPPKPLRLASAVRLLFGAMLPIAHAKLVRFKSRITRDLWRAGIRW